MHLIIVRHGESLGQIASKGAWPGPDSALSPLGEEQARKTAECLAECGVSHMLSSPMIRALSTTSIMAETIGCDTFEVWTELRELWERTYRGFSRVELHNRFPRAVLSADITADGWEHGDDTYEAMFDRCYMVLQMLRMRFTDSSTVVMVTHGGFSNYLLHALLNIPGTMPTWFKTANCAITRVQFIPEAERPCFLPWYPAVPVEVLGINDMRHLGGTVTY